MQKKTNEPFLVFRPQSWGWVLKSLVMAKFRVDVDFDDGRRHQYPGSCEGKSVEMLATAYEMITEIIDNMTYRERQESKIYLIIKSKANDTQIEDLA